MVAVVVGVALLDYPVIPPVATLVQVYCVPTKLEVKLMPVLCPLHIVVLVAVGVTVGLGVIVTVNVKGVPVQPLAVGVMV